MTEKRMIDADALLAWVKIQIMSVHFVNYQSTIENNIYQKVIDKINELATTEESLVVDAFPANEPIFDKDGWCWDFSHLKPEDTYHFLIRTNYTKRWQTLHTYRTVIELYKGRVLAWRPLPPVPSK